MKKLRRLFILLILAGSAYAGWNYRDLLINFYQKKIAKNVPPKEMPQPDPKRYQKLISELEERRLDLSKRYSRARTAREISDVVAESQRTLERMLPAMMRCWLGTPWDFNGICQTPGSGKIACGYFVSTLLRDAGFGVERIRLAQQPSQYIIGTFISKKMMTIRAGQNYDTFVDQAKERGPGIHIVGLDNHVAFVVIPESGGIRFIHSSGAHPFCVVDEDRSEAGSLQRSNYRVIGNLTRSPEVIHGWLVGQKWPTKISSGN
ncbi:MAG: hypothetical protein P8M04_08830 [Akkermansiaceae bacterium]|nr:hypothetical protein [Akkermansiaceae bacterium]